MSKRQTVLMVSALVVSVVAFQLNTTMLIPAIHAINDEFGRGAFATMSTYFSLSGAVSSVVLIRWSDYVGRKRVLIGVMSVMCGGTVLCIVATSLGLMVVGRMLQGGSVITFGLAFMIMREHLSGPAFGTCCGLVTAINGGVAGFDSLLGGVMVDRLGYRSVFVLSVIVAAVALAFAWKAVPADRPFGAGTDRMDWWGASLLSLAAVAVNLFLSHGGRDGWVSPTTLGWIVVGIVSLIALTVVEGRLAHPLLALDHMRSRQAWPLIVATILCVASFMTMLTFIVPSIGEDDDSGFALTGTMTALLLLTPAAVVQLITAPLAGRLAVRIGFVTVLRAGVASSTVVAASLAVFVENLSMIVALMVVFGFTFTGVLLTALSTLGVVQAPDDEPGSLPGINGVAFGIGGSAGFAWAGPVVGTGTVSSFQTALWACVVIGVAALILSLILKPKPGPVVTARVDVA
jgi:predicted MFS family arabinose efflux permease